MAVYHSKVLILKWRLVLNSHGFTRATFVNTFSSIYLSTMHHLTLCVTHFCVMINRMVYLYVPVQDVPCMNNADG